MQKRTVAVIGSFRQFHSEIQTVCSYLIDRDIEVTSPTGKRLIQEGIQFVRFETDNVDFSDAHIQSIALHRILRADMVYVIAPQGYVGKTTCYEIGRVIQGRVPLYFSEPPKDLPIKVHSEFVLTLTNLAAHLADQAWQPSWLYLSDQGPIGSLERNLIDGIYQDD